MSLRDIKRRARRDLHDRMQVPAIYVPAAGGDPVLVNVRLHTQFKLVGAATAPGSAAERQDETPKIRFDRGQVIPARGAIVSVEAGEAYRVMNIHRPDDEFQFADVVPLSAAEAEGLPLPANADTYQPSFPFHPGVGVPAGGAGGQILRKTGETDYAMDWSNDSGALTFVIDGGLVEILPGEKGDLVIPFNCQITGMAMIADVVGSIEVDVWRGRLEELAPGSITEADSITADAPPMITDAMVAADTSLHGWTLDLQTGDVLRFVVNSATSVTRVTLTFTARKR